MCAQPGQPIPEQEDNSTIWVIIQRPLHQHPRDQCDVEPEGESQAASGQSTPALNGAVPDPIARWLSERPAEAPWHKLQACRIVDHTDTNQNLVLSSTGATMSSREH
ncbi:hypothetical protein VP1G_05374 [Cytospora mali]|uniref:Uncharacterized protein n=1 Tax=Cytospora mali TaxID=578113 RepID=A0A194V2C7_CYTMA|nr:hypothetical protein VP1G_05374 [Valsa mali var. pyri (nom. inval.)]